MRLAVDLGDLVRPLLNVVGREISASIDQKQLAVEILVILKVRTDKQWAEMIDRCVKGGKIAEALDYSLALSYVKKLRAWCEGMLK